MKFIKNVLIFSTIVMSTSVLAHDRYDTSYYEDEGDLLFKVGGFYSDARLKPKATPVNQNAQQPGDLMSVGYGANASTTYFFSDHFATELSLGAGIFKVRKTELGKAAGAYGDGTGDSGKNNKIFFIPLAATIQYHVAPFGGIRPYIGAGYHGTYLHSRSKSFKIKRDHGPVFQLGVDFFAKDDTIITLDVKKYYLSSKLTFKKEFLFPGNTTTAKDFSSDVKLDPLVISLGIGFKF